MEEATTLNLAACSPTNARISILVGLNSVHRLQGPKVTYFVLRVYADIEKSIVTTLDRRRSYISERVPEIERRHGEGQVKRTLQLEKGSDADGKQGGIGMNGRKRETTGAVIWQRFNKI
ncbi:hypothetical protein WN48_10194 [Eufriesea mexicana]|nr:hypothetical protein WN48_10194 [Eufriesea mexicana]